ncbi:EAL domain-containing protein [Babesia caballi]|uniref:EAL domain-containing protein n=1 Tax=Babesia caballi TaxID=5871 RepID=A0AAV4LN37_BABCB|nr:EAL domain-containing protein [Babesia caballi]
MRAPASWTRGWWMHECQPTATLHLDGGTVTYRCVVVGIGAAIGAGIGAGIGASAGFAVSLVDAIVAVIADVDPIVVAVGVRFMERLGLGFGKARLERSTETRPGDPGFAPLGQVLDMVALVHAAAAPGKETVRRFHVLGGPIPFAVLRKARLRPGAGIPVVDIQIVLVTVIVVVVVSVQLVVVAVDALDVSHEPPTSYPGEDVVCDVRGRENSEDAHAHQRSAEPEPGLRHGSGLAPIKGL